MLGKSIQEPKSRKMKGWAMVWCALNFCEEPGTRHRVYVTALRSNGDSTKEVPRASGVPVPSPALASELGFLSSCLCPKPVCELGFTSSCLCLWYSLNTHSTLMTFKMFLGVIKMLCVSFDWYEVEIKIMTRKRGSSGCCVLTPVLPLEGLALTLAKWIKIPR